MLARLHAREPCEIECDLFCDSYDLYCSIWNLECVQVYLIVYFNFNFNGESNFKSCVP